MHGLPLAALAMPPSATGAIARLAAARITEGGLDLAALLRKAGLTASQIQDRQARVAVAAQISFLNLAAEALRDDLLGFHLAQAFEPREIGLPYFVLASSATLGDAMARAERYSTIRMKESGCRARRGAIFAFATAISACRGIRTVISSNSGRRRLSGSVAP